MLKLDGLGILWERVPREWKSALEMLQVMTSKEYFLARRDTVRELGLLCSRVLSGMM